MQNYGLGKFEQIVLPKMPKKPYNLYARSAQLVKIFGIFKKKSHWVSMALLLPLLLPTAALTAAAIIQTMYDAHCNTVCVFHFHLNLFHILAIVQLDTYAFRFHLDSEVHYF